MVAPVVRPKHFLTGNYTDLGAFVAGLQRQITKLIASDKACRTVVEQLKHSGSDKLPYFPRDPGGPISYPWMQAWFKSLPVQLRPSNRGVTVQVLS